MYSISALLGTFKTTGLLLWRRTCSLNQMPSASFIKTFSLSPGAKTDPSSFSRVVLHFSTQGQSSFWNETIVDA
jgi:hypothetical protein